MTGETLASKLQKVLTEDQDGVVPSTRTIEHLVRTVAHHQKQAQDEVIEALKKDVEHWKNAYHEAASISEGTAIAFEKAERGMRLFELKAESLEQVLEEQNGRLHALKQAVNVSSPPRGIEALFRPVPPEQARQIALIKTAEWVLRGDAKNRPSSVKPEEEEGEKTASEPA